jgi:hypothetical protein
LKVSKPNLVQSHQRLDGGRFYTLHMPKDAPAALFWAVTVYDNETRCLIDTGTFPERTSKDEIVINADGSVDLGFGPSLPGSGRSVTGAGSHISASMARPNPILIARGSCLISLRWNDGGGGARPVLAKLR